MAIQYLGPFELRLSLVFFLLILIFTETLSFGSFNRFDQLFTRGAQASARGWVTLGCGAYLCPKLRVNRKERQEAIREENSECLRG